MISSKEVILENKLILNTDCYVQEGCKKYTNNLCTEQFCVRLYKIDELYNKALLTKEQRIPLRLRLDNNRIDEAPYTKLKSYQKNIIDFVNEGINLYIFSNTTGNGKTSWAIKLLQAYIHKIWASSDLTCRVLFINVPNFMRELKLNISQKSDYIKHINDNVLNADIVVWDDIATKGTSEFEHEQLISIIDTRMNNKKSNIFTSNINPQDLPNMLGARLASRIIGLSECIPFNGYDKRGVS